MTYINKHTSHASILAITPIVLCESFGEREEVTVEIQKFYFSIVILKIEQFTPLFAKLSCELQSSYSSFLQSTKDGLNA